ncbi:malectin-like [Watersipora subatra]|uniref:malectin-like n=1 Tax=Watersipora subatra TaxID=2589382 RepID=UPI00355C977C
MGGCIPMISNRFKQIVITLCVILTSTNAALNIVWSINAGGEKHTDIHGIRYNRDPLTIGEASDYGTTMQIGRVAPPDQILYQTERYHFSDFNYNIPLREDGDYVLVLKFCEVWFNAPNQKVFNVQLNDVHDVVKNLDIFGKVGRAVAHDEIIPFQVKNKKLIVNGRKSDIEDNSVSLTLLKGERDNPKLNAAYVMKGSLADVPTLPPLPQQEVDDVEEEEEEEEIVRETPQDTKKRAHTSGPKVQDPYAMSDSSSMLIPIVIAVAAFIPLLYCLCKI